MAPTAKIDRFDTLEMVERFGNIATVTRKAIVTGLEGVDFSVMYDALEAAGIPEANAKLDNTGSSAGLRVRERSVKMVDKGTAEVLIRYGLLNDEGQSFSAGGFESAVFNVPALSGRMSCSVQQTTTNLYEDPDDDDGIKRTIILQHTWPLSDPDYPGKTVQQSGEIQVFVPQKTYVVEGYAHYYSPNTIADSVIGCVNDRKWLSGDENTWMCTEVTWKYAGSKTGDPVGASDYYHMSFQFQHNPDTWNPTAVFIDERTGRPPENLVAGEGYQYIRYHKAVNFIQKLGFLLIGGSYSA